MKNTKITFKCVYFIYLSILVVAVIAAIVYVNGLLHKYEDSLPERCVETAIDTLVADAASGDFWSKYALPEATPEKFEESMDVKKEYLALYAEDDITFSQKNGTHGEDELYYTVENGGVVLAEVKLKAAGPAVTKLAVLNFGEWQIEYVKPIFEKGDYTLSVPSDFYVSANGIMLTAADGVAGNENEITYTIEDVYLEPVFDITDKDGNVVTYTVDNKKVIAEFYDYSLTLPTALHVEVDGESYPGQALDGNRVRYDIRTLEKPVVSISDYYGNVMDYEGGNKIPLTYMTISADSRYTVEVSGNAVASEAISTFLNPEYEQLTPYVENVPQVSVFDVAILENDAEIIVKDENGTKVSLEENKTTHDFTERVNSLETVPEEVSTEIDVLEIAQSWSLFMSDDMPFSQFEQYMILDSYQYNVALQYATGVDITFTSSHTLANPAFTDNVVTNFVWLSDNSFSVDISFVKHMILKSGKRVDDPMNDRFYFVKYDDTDDEIDNPTWKIASMKEIVNNEK